MPSYFLPKRASLSKRLNLFDASRPSLQLEQLEDRRVLHGSPLLQQGPVDDEGAAVGNQLGVVQDYVQDEILVSFDGEVADLFGQQGAGAALGRASRAVEALGLRAPQVLMHTADQPGRGSRLATRWALPPGSDVMATIEQLGNVPGVAFAEPNYVLTASVIPDDSSFGDLWGMHNTGQSGGTVDADIDAPEAWDVHTGTQSVVVGVIDSGVNMGHADLAANIWTNPYEIAGNGVDDDGNGYVDDVNGWDFVDNDNDPHDDFKHGTHVSGTIVRATPSRWAASTTWPFWGASARSWDRSCGWAAPTRCGTTVSFN